MGIEETISASLAEAREADSVADTGDTGDTGDIPIADAGGNSEGIVELVAQETDTGAKEADKVVEAPAADKAAVDPVTGAKVKEDEDPLAQELGPAKDKSGRDTRVPHSRVQVIAGNAAKRAEAAALRSVAESLGLDMTSMTPDLLQARVKTALSDVTALRERSATMDAVEPIMRDDPDEFVRRLARVNPKYQKFLSVIDGSERTKQPEKQTASPLAEMPGPNMDITLPDGSKSKTYDIEGVKAVLEWHRTGITRDLEEKIGTRVKPFEDERTSREQQRSSNQEKAAYLEDLLGEMKEYDGFTENEPAIKEALAKIPKNIPMGRALRTAYQQVVVQKLKTDKAAMHAQILEDMKRAPTSTAVVGKTVARPDNDVVRNEDGEVVGGTEAVVRRAMAAARAAGKIK